MEPTRDNRKPEDAVRSNTAVTGGNRTGESAESGAERSDAARSWRQYIDQSLPAQNTEAEAGQEGAGVRPAGPDVKAAAKAAWERCSRWAARWTQKRGEKIRARAEEYWEWLDFSTGDFRVWLSEAAVDSRKKLNAAAVNGRKKLRRIVAAGREMIGQGANMLAQGVWTVRGLVARHPISPLLYVTLIAVGIGVVAFQNNYARAYVMEVNGQELGLVSGKDEMNAILSSVETRAASILGDDFDYSVDVTLSPVYAAPGELTDAAEMEDVLFQEVGAYMTAWAISVDGEELAYAADEGELYQLLDEIAQPYIPADAVRYGFLEDVQIYPVELPSNTVFKDLEPIREELSDLRVEEAVYVVKKGDTFNAIAYSLGMQPNELSILNPDVIVNQLWVDQELVIQQAVPRLSVMAVADETYEQIIPSPVEYIETADLYVGDTKVKEQGEDGLAQVTAQVAYLNNVEQDREILESTTIKEATTTYTYTGTTPRPVTASNGYFIWPVRGTITSNFGGRNLWGSYDYHLGIDICVAYGTGVKAADGGTVIKAGWEGTYGNLVAIRHDNGIITYYAHNSAILVSVGQKVYQGQIIAKVGATGNASGPHCHFEVRVNGTSVNPRNYLS